MTEYTLVGDIHADIEGYERIVYCTNNPVIQIGDFGLGFRMGEVQRKQTILHHETKGRSTFIRGNHDDPAACPDTPGWIADGTVRNDTMFIGGAWSIDGVYRQIFNMLWWPEEECTENEFDKMLDVYKVTKPRVMITHDGPGSVTKRMFTDAGLGMPNTPHIKTRTGEYLDRMFEYHQPEEWYYGHWHHTKTEVINGTKFSCLGIFATTTVEL